MRVYESYVSCVNEGRVLQKGKALNIPITNINLGYLTDEQFVRMIAENGIRCVIVPFSPMGPISKREESIKDLQLAANIARIQPEVRVGELQNGGVTLEFTEYAPTELFDLCNGLKATLGVTNVYNLLLHEVDEVEPVALIYPRDVNETEVGGDKYTDLNYEIIGFNIKEDDETGELLLDNIVIKSDPYINIVDKDAIAEVGANVFMRCGFLDTTKEEIVLSEGHETDNGTLYTVHLTGEGEEYGRYNPINKDNPLLLWMYRLYSNKGFI